MLNFAYDYNFTGNEAGDSDNSDTGEDDFVYAVNEEIISETLDKTKEYMQSGTVYGNNGTTSQVKLTKTEIL